MKRLLSLFLIWMALVYTLNAQDARITGTVTSQADDTPLIGVTVVVKGSTRGTITDVNGSFNLEARIGDTLTFSFIGYISENIAVTEKTVYDIALTPDLQALDEVVVTALGIQKKSRALTYSTQKVGGDELTAVKDVNMVNSLSGRSAGLVVTRGGSGVGSSSKVILRGNTSISGNNQPLYVIDGIPLNNANGDQPNTLYEAVDGGDGISNLNPEDIESINVLKGASASALYGSQAANGVILITTKQGQEGTTKVNYSLTSMWDSPLMLPEVQTSYQETNPVDGITPDSWGAAGSGSDAHLSDYFETGLNLINNISISTGNQKAKVFVSYANTTAKGIVPENRMSRNNFNIQTTAKIWKDKVMLNAGAQFINQDIKNRPYTGFYYNPMIGLYTFPTGADFNQYTNYESYDNIRRLNAQNWRYTGVSNYSIQNPYWIANRNQNTGKRNRYLTSFKATWHIADYLNLVGRINYDHSSDDFEHMLHATSDEVIVHRNGSYLVNNATSGFLYNDFLLNFSKSIGQSLDLSANLGTSLTSARNTFLGMSAHDNKSGLLYANWFNAANMGGTPEATDNTRSPFTRTQNDFETFDQAIFFTAQVGYNNLLFLDVTGRNEWSSTLSSDGTGSFFYPSAGLTLVISELTGTGNVFDYGKLRASYSEVGNSLPLGAANPNSPMRVDAGGTIQAPLAAAPNGTTLLPERTKSYEVGFESRFFNNALTLDLTYYNALTVDQVFQVPAPSGSGVQNYWINGGEIRNTGVELMLGYRLITNSGFSWQPSVNYARNINKVEVLNTGEGGADYTIITRKEDTKIYELRIAEGGSFGDMYGFVWDRDANGNIVANEDGTPRIKVDEDDNPVIEKVGNYNPEYSWGINNAFSYKGVNLSFLIDAKIGGTVLGYTEAVLDGWGLSKRSGDDRAAGQTTQGGTSFDPQTFYTNAGGSDPVAEQYAYDATNIRLRELSLGYTFQTPLFGQVVKGLTVSLIGRNLFFIKNDAPFDPEVSLSTGNGLQGLESFTLPTVRSIGFSVKASF